MKMSYSKRETKLKKERDFPLYALQVVGSATYFILSKCLIVTAGSTHTNTTKEREKETIEKSEEERKQGTEDETSYPNLGS